MSVARAEVSSLLRTLAEDPAFASALPCPLDDYIGKLVDRAELATWYVAGRMCGLIAFYANDPERRDAFISMVAIAPELRRMGIARALLGAVLRSLSDRGFVQCRLEVRAYNKRAIRLYRGIGFEPDGMLDDIVKMRIQLPITTARPS